MHRPPLAFAIIAALAVLPAGAAAAEDPMCVAHFYSVGGVTKGAFSTTKGTACSVPVAVIGHDFALTSVAIVRSPRNGTASAGSTGFRYRPSPGFTGQDSMAVLYSGIVGSTGRPHKAAVVFEIGVH